MIKRHSAEFRQAWIYSALQTYRSILFGSTTLLVWVRIFMVNFNSLWFFFFPLQLHKVAIKNRTNLKKKKKRKSTNLFLNGILWLFFFFNKVLLLTWFIVWLKVLNNTVGGVYGAVELAVLERLLWAVFILWGSNIFL